jgi:flagellar motor switch protein FliN/FliY
MSDTPETVGQSDVEKLLAEAQAANAPAGAAGSVESLLEQAQAGLKSLEESTTPLPPGVTPFEFKDLQGTAAANETASLDLLRDVQLDLKIELGRTHMHLEEVLRLKKGAVVTLDKLAGDPVDIYANGRLIARGEVLVLNDNFCVRVAELTSGEEAAA